MQCAIDAAHEAELSAMSTDARVQVEDGTAVNFDPINSELEYLNADLDSGTLEEDYQDLATVQAHGRQSFVFLDEDPEFQALLAEGGANPSARADRWATNRLNSFREFKGLDSSFPFCNLKPMEIVALLTKFFEQTCKLDGSLYPSQSLMSLYRAFHRLIIRSQEARIQETGIDEPRVSLKTSLIFKPIGVACVAAMARSRNAGANLPRKKASVISLADESVILGHAYTAVTHPRGLQKRVAYYMLSRFCIRGGSELYNLHASDFRFGTDKSGDTYVRYDERLSKNYKVSLERYQEEHFRPAITEFDPDVVHTMELLIEHLPISVAESDRFLFHQAIDNPRIVAWYSASRVSLRNLGKWLKLIHIECGLLADGITNKSGRTTCVTRMAAEGVPSAVGMLITGHKSVGGYSRYDRTNEAKVKVAQKCVAEGSAFQETVKEEEFIMKGKMIHGPHESNVRLSNSLTVETEVLQPLHQQQQLVQTEQPIGMQPVHPAASSDSVASSQQQVQQQQQAARNAMHLLQRVLRPCKRQRIPLVAPLVEPEVLPERELPENNNMLLPELVSMQSTEEYDEWAQMIDWEEVEEDLTSGGFLVAKTINNNPITAAFGKIQAMSHCNVTINFNSSGASRSGFANAFGPT